VYRPAKRLSGGGLYWIHGGGLLFGDARQDEALCAGTARELGVSVVSANYRFAPEHPFPAALNDVAAGWSATLNHAADLHIDSDRLAIGGESAGGGLAASLVQRLKDEGGIQPVAQWLFAPMLDDRTGADESLDSIEHWVWNNRTNRYAWNGYLSGGAGADELPAYAAAARRKDLSGLPPTFITYGDIELFANENAIYANRLATFGVPVTTDVVSGAPHGFENWARATEPARELLARSRRWLGAAIGEASSAHEA
jgi:acetyl esterase/lipase